MLDHEARPAESKESEFEVSSLLTILVISITSIGVVALGVMSAYGSVILILEAVSYQSSPRTMRPLVLTPTETQAGGD